MYIASIIISIVIYSILQYIDDNRNYRNGKPSSSTTVKISLFFFVLMIVTGISYLFWSNEPTSPTKIGGSQETYLSQIKEEIDVGLSPF